MLCTYSTNTPHIRLLHTQPFFFPLFPNPYYDYDLYINYEDKDL
jgi:hypothetical protein